MSSYAWIITKDLIAEPSAKAGSYQNAVGLIGPRDATDEQCEKLKAGNGFRFRIRDDDEEIYYYGLLLGNKDSEDGFAPLDDFARPNAGATEIQYMSDKPCKACEGEPGKSWETL